MKRSGFSEEQIVKILKTTEAGVPVEELLRTHGISRATFYNWRKKYGGLEVDDAKRHLSLDKQMLQDVLSRKW
jgi:putative transposase